MTELTVNIPNINQSFSIGTISGNAKIHSQKVAVNIQNGSIIISGISGSISLSKMDSVSDTAFDIQKQIVEGKIIIKGNTISLINSGGTAVTSISLINEHVIVRFTSMTDMNVDSELILSYMNIFLLIIESLPLDRIMDWVSTNAVALTNIILPYVGNSIDLNREGATIFIQSHRKILELLLMDVYQRSALRQEYGAIMDDTLELLDKPHQTPSVGYSMNRRVGCSQHDVMQCIDIGDNTLCVMKRGNYQ